MNIRFFRGKVKAIVLLVLLIFVGLGFNSCSSPTEMDLANEKIHSITNTDYRLVTVDGQYSIQIPKFMELNPGINAQSTRNYSNLFKEKHVKIRCVSKKDALAFVEDQLEGSKPKLTLENYADARIANFLDRADKVSTSSRSEVKLLNERKSIKVIIDANLLGIAEDVTHFFAFIEGDDHFYTIEAWTPSNRKEAYVSEVESMLNSFKEF